MSSPEAMSEGVLDGIRVLDLCRDLSGPYTSMMLAEFGADVIEVEHHLTGDETRVWPPIVGGISGYFASINRSKRSLAVDLKDPDGKAAVLELAAKADVVMQSFTPGVAARLGIGYDDVSRDNPGVVYYSLSGYGQDGPWREKRGYDPILQAASGFMSLTGENGRGPVKSIVPIADLSSSIYGFASIMAALFRRERTGKGQHIDNSMMDVGVSMLSVVGTRYLMTGVVPERNGTENPQRVPSAAFGCSDGRYLQVVPNQRQWPAFCAVLGRPDWVSDERFATPTSRIEHQAELYPMIREAFLDKTADVWSELLGDATIACSPIYSMDEVFDLPQVKHREMVQSYHLPAVGEVPAISLPFKLSETPPRIRSAPPYLGEHSVDVLRELGRSEDQIAQMIERKAVTVTQAQSGGVA
ncbi:MAG: L-carnitine dehydratase/bile acid-inducible protein [Marmoricola sp.]|nr:L-carnitine dehydratase/bile acid-inducible protein [Marmoricola sp.]